MPYAIIRFKILAQEARCMKFSCAPRRANIEFLLQFSLHKLFPDTIQLPISEIDLRFWVRQ